MKHVKIGNKILVQGEHCWVVIMFRYTTCYDHKSDLKEPLYWKGW